MVDYYPVLARAVSRLQVNSAQARQDVYEHARIVLITNLDKRGSQTSALRIISEWIAFETAVRGVEEKSRSVRERMPETLKARLDALREIRRPAFESGSHGPLLECAE